MTALAAERQIVANVQGLRYLPVADNVVIYKGALVCVDTAGYARPGRASTTDICVGVAQKTVDNTILGHTAGTLFVTVRDDLVAYFTSGTSADLIANASVGLPCYVMDDQTVGLTTGSSTRIAAGNIYWVNEAGQVGVKFTK